MSRRDRHHDRHAERRDRSGGLLRWLPVVLVLALLAGAGAAYRFDLGPRWFGTGTPDPTEEPAAVAPPDGLSLPGLTTPDLLAQPANAPAANSAKVRRALAPFLADDALGTHVVAAVGDLAGDDLLADIGNGPATPASTMKLLTTTAALATLGPDRTFATTVVGRGRTVTLKGGGDPFLAAKPQRSAWPARADVVTLAQETADALKADGRGRVNVQYDDSLFTGPGVNPRWPSTYVPEGVVAPIGALWVDEASDGTLYGKVADPPAVAATAFATALASEGIEVIGTPAPGKAPDRAPELGRVESAPLGQIVEKILLTSDNEGAEVLSRQVGLATSGDGSWRGGADGVRTTLTGLGVDLSADEVYDGSGLSRENLLSATTLLAVLRLAGSEQQPGLRHVISGLPVAGFSGSLAFRFTSEALPARGYVRAKTGTLSGVSALAGVATDRDGSPLAFVLLADEVALADTEAARDALDELAAALASCRCAS